MSWEAGWYRIKGPEVGTRVGYHREDDFHRLDGYREKGYLVDLILLVSQEELDRLIEVEVIRRLTTPIEEFTI